MFDLNALGLSCRAGCIDDVSKICRTDGIIRILATLLLNVWPVAIEANDLQSRMEDRRSRVVDAQTSVLN